MLYGTSKPCSSWLVLLHCRLWRRARTFTLCFKLLHLWGLTWAWSCSGGAGRGAGVVGGLQGAVPVRGACAAASLGGACHGARVAQLLPAEAQHPGRHPAGLLHVSAIVGSAGRTQADVRFHGRLAQPHLLPCRQPWVPLLAEPPADLLVAARQTYMFRRHSVPV